MIFMTNVAVVAKRCWCVDSETGWGSTCGFGRPLLLAEAAPRDTERRCSVGYARSPEADWFTAEFFVVVFSVRGVD